jgi:zinc transport system substrate-binding protein
MKRIVWLGVLFLVVSGCLTQQPKENETVQVVVTILPQAEFVEKIGGDLVQVTVMVPPGASPHTYEPTPSQLMSVSKAQLYCEVGSGVEFELVWMDRVVNMNTDMVVVDCSEGVQLVYAGDHQEHERGYDPHIWLSPQNAVLMVETMYKGLVQVDPMNKEYYSQNKIRYIEELEELDRDIVKALSAVTTRRIMVYHPSWTYFCRDYGLEQIPIEEEGKEPTPQGIQHVVEQAQRYHIKVIFTSPQFSTEAAEVIAHEIGGQVVLIDPLAKSYVENMLKVAHAFAEVQYEYSFT